MHHRGMPFEMDMKSIHQLLFRLFLELIPENIRNVVGKVLMAIGLLFLLWGIVVVMIAEEGEGLIGFVLILAGFFVFASGVTVLNPEVLTRPAGNFSVSSISQSIQADAVSGAIKSIRAGDEVDEANQHDGGEHYDSASTPESNNGRETTTAPLAQKISCPQCNQRLNVPSNYTGLVGCPSCKEKIQLDEGGISVTE